MPQSLLMSRSVRGPVLAVLLAALLTGCANFVETRTIDHFMLALKEGDLDGVRGLASESFSRRALRRAESLDDMRILRLPTDEATVVEVEDVSETEKEVTVQVGEGPRKLLYRLVQEEDTGDWVVDDIYMRQKRKGLQTTRSVSEQMDLLLSVREFLEAWDSGSRDRVLDVTTPALREELEPLSKGQIGWLSRRIVDEGNRSDSVKPEAQLDGDAAVVRLPQATGEMILSYRLHKGHWLVDDVAVEARDSSKHVHSLRKTAAVLVQATAFLAAFERQDEEALSKVCSESLFRRSLAPADLADVPLPSASALDRDFQLTLSGQRADVIVEGAEQVVTISMERQADQVGKDRATDYRIREVTLYELKNRQQMRLSVLFTGRAIVQIAAQSLARGDLPMLQKISTSDLNQRVWRRLEDRDDGGRVQATIPLSDLPLDRFVPRGAVPLRTEYLGAVTKYYMPTAEGQQLVYHLRDRAGDVRIDDVVLSTPNAGSAARQHAADGAPRSNGALSLKSSLEVLIPIRFVAMGLRDGRIPLVERYASEDFNRLVWSQLRRMPATGPRAFTFLDQQLSTLQVLNSDESTLVQLGTLRQGAQVSILKERGRFVVDDALLTSGPQPEQQAKLKHRLVQEMASGGLPVGEPARRQYARHVNHSEPQAESHGRATTGTRPGGSVINAGYSVETSDTPAERSPRQNDIAPLEPADDAFNPPAGVHSSEPGPVRPARGRLLESGANLRRETSTGPRVTATREAIERPVMPRQPATAREAAALPAVPRFTDPEITEPSGSSSANAAPAEETPSERIMRLRRAAMENPQQFHTSDTMDATGTTGHQPEGAGHRLPRPRSSFSPGTERPGLPAAYTDESTPAIPRSGRYTVLAPARSERESRNVDPYAADDDTTLPEARPYRRSPASRATTAAR